MSQYTIAKSLFQSGELRPAYAGRTDSDIFATGCALMCNALPDALGGFKKRPGTHFFGSVDQNARKPMELYTEAVDYYIEATEAAFNVYDADEPGSLLCSVAHSYGTHIRSVQYRTNKGVLYIVHRLHAPATLKVTVSGSTYTATLAAIQFVSDPDDSERCVTFSASGGYPSVISFKGGRMYLGATDDQPSTVWASRTPTGGADRYNDFTLYDTNWDFETSEDTSVVSGKTYYEYQTQQFVLSTDTAVDPDTIYYELNGGNYERKNPVGTEDPVSLGWYVLVNLTTGQYVPVSPAGTENPAQLCWYEYVGSKEPTNSHAIEVEENDMWGTRILWFAVQNRLICGTSRSVLMDSGSAATPATFDLMVVLNTGASDIQAKSFKNYVCFSGHTGKALFLMGWDDNSQGYVTVDMSRNSSHLLKSGIKDFDIMLDPIPTVWIITNDGKLLSCSYDATTGLTGWARHTRKSGTWSGLCVAGKDHDRLFLTIEDGGYYHSEYLDLIETDEIEEGWYVDCGKEYTSLSAVSTFQNLPAPLEGKDIVAIGDNGLMPPKKVSSGTVTYGRAVKHLIAGLPIETTVKTFTPEIPANGTSQGKNRRIRSVTLKLYQSFGGFLSEEVSQSIQELLYRRYGATSYGAEIELFSGDMEMKIDSRNTKSGAVKVYHDQPAPFNVLSLITKYEILEA